MGGRSSKENSWNSSFRSSSSSWGGGYFPSSNGQDSQSYSAQQSFAPPPYSYPPPHDYVYDGGHATVATRRLERRYSRIADDCNSLEQRSFNGRSLHHIGDGLNPYEQEISIIGKTLAPFNEDNLIPCFGFGNASTYNQDVFSFYPDDTFCNGFEEVLRLYREIVPHLRLAGPTSFAPVVEMAMTIVEQSGGQYHVLVIIADDQVTGSIDTERGKLSPHEQKTIDAIVKASNYPLSIILVGVGDGPWDMMKEFDVDNFQFVNFTEIMSKNATLTPSRKETEFALAALMEIPSQYKTTKELNLLGSQKGNSPQRVALPPPVYCASSVSSSKPVYDGASSFSSSKPSHSTSFEPIVPPYHVDSIHENSASPAPSSTYDD